MWHIHTREHLLSLKKEGRSDTNHNVGEGIPTGSAVKNSPAMQETRDTPTWSLGWEDPLEEGMATQSSILAWRIPRGRGVWRATIHLVAKSRTRLSDSVQHSQLYF